LKKASGVLNKAFPVFKKLLRTTDFDLRVLDSTPNFFDLQLLVYSINET